MPVAPWTEPDAHSWDQRVPRLVRLSATPVALVAGVAAEAVADDGLLDAATALSAANAVWGLAQGLVLGALALCALVPRAAGAAGLVGAAALGVTPLEPARGAWLVVAAVLAALVLADAVTLARQRLVSNAWHGTDSLVPDLAPEVTQALRTVRLWRAGVVVLGVVGAVVAGAWYLHDASAATAFHARATEADGVVLEIAQDGTSAQVDLGDRVVRVPVVGPPAVGDLVRVATAGARSELTTQAFDPTGTLVLAATLLVVAAGVGADERLRRRRTERLLVGASAVRAVLVDVRRGELQVAPRDAVAARVALLPVVVERVADATTDDLAPGADVFALDDETVFALARAAEEESAQDEAARRRAAAARTPWWPAGSEVDLVGLTDDLSPLAVRGPDGRWAVAPRPGRPHAARVSAEVQPAPAGSTAPADGRPDGRADLDPAGPSHGAWRQLVARLDRAAATTARATGRWAPWLLLPAPGVFGWWVAPAHDLKVLLLVLGAYGVGSTWVRMARPALRLEPDRLVVTGTWLDTAVPWSEVTRVAADGADLLLGWGAASSDVDPDADEDDEPDDGRVLVVLGTGPARPPLTADGLSAHQAAARIRREADRAGGSGTLRRRPALPAVAGLAWAFALAAGLAAGW